jgi:hypothetical protein
MRALAALALLLGAFAAPPAFAQGGGVTAPHSGGVPAPDPAPEPTPLAPDAAPGGGSDSVQAAPSPTLATPPDTTSSAPQASPPAVAASEPAAPRADRRRPHTSGKRAARTKVRNKRNAGQQDQRSRVERTSPASVFRSNLRPVGWVGRYTDAESPPVELIALALLTLVVASAGLLRLTMRLSQIEGLTPPKRATSRAATR